jgi:hypothetical protein
MAIGALHRSRQETLARKPMFLSMSHVRTNGKQASFRGHRFEVRARFVFGDLGTTVDGKKDPHKEVKSTSSA